MLLGRVESTERFLRVALFQGMVKTSAARLHLRQQQKLQQQQQRQAGGGAGGNIQLFEQEEQESADGQGMPASAGLQAGVGRDPSLFATAYRKQRFYIFSQREPIDESSAMSDQHRDVFNEKPTKQDVEAHQELLAVQLPREATIHTSMGDIVCKLHPDLCPKAVENFCGLAQKGYYNDMIFHRVIKGFMIQTGDPKGDGTGGMSVWGTEFRDEFHSSLKHNTGFKLSMANAGPNSNGSQFFVTVAPAAWLDGKHTLFGEVVRGKEVALRISQASTDKNDKPFEPVKMLSVEVNKASA